jgi:hypothetical protein
MKREAAKNSRWKCGNQTADSHIPTAPATTATLSHNRQQKEPSKARLIHCLQAHPSIGKDSEGKGNGYNKFGGLI